MLKVGRKLGNIFVVVLEINAKMSFVYVCICVLYFVCVFSKHENGECWLYSKKKLTNISKNKNSLKPKQMKKKRENRNERNERNGRTFRRRFGAHVVIDEEQESIFNMSVEEPRNLDNSSFIDLTASPIPSV